jgi:hypothetical protein
MRRQFEMLNTTLKFVDVRVSETHTLLMSKTGEVFGCGLGEVMRYFLTFIGAGYRIYRQYSDTYSDMVVEPKECQ